MNSEAWTQVGLIVSTIIGALSAYGLQRIGADKIKELADLKEAKDQEIAARDVQIAVMKTEKVADREKIADRDRQIEQLEAERAEWLGQRRTALSPPPAKGSTDAVQRHP